MVGTDFPTYMDVTIYKLKSKDAQKLSDLVDIYADVFEMKKFEKPSNEYFEQMLSQESVIVYVAENNQEIIGGLTAHILPSTYFESAEVYIYDLGVKEEFQRSGIGTMLVEDFNDYCSKRGFKEMFVQADTVDEHAVAFYKKIGGFPEEDVIHFSFPLNKD